MAIKFNCPNCNKEVYAKGYGEKYKCSSCRQVFIEIPADYSQASVDTYRSWLIKNGMDLGEPYSDEDLETTSSYLATEKAKWLRRSAEARKRQNNSDRIEINEKKHSVLDTAMITKIDNFFGIGTQFHGKRDFLPDGSYLTTEWCIILYVPIFPFKSYRVIDKGSSYSFHLFYDKEIHTWSIIRKLPTNAKQTLYIYAYTYGLIPMLLIIARSGIFESLPGMLPLAIAVICLSTPFILRIIAKSKLPDWP